MIPKKVTFSDIQTSSLLYYDPILNDLCFRFCEQRDIDSLPSLNDPNVFYRRTIDGFSKEFVPQERKVYGHQNVFASSLLDSFRAYKLLFVYTAEELTGVVHFCDYNCPVVNSFLFDLLSAFERLLRRLLQLKGLKNEDMLRYFQEKVDTSKKEKDIGYYQGRLKEYERLRAQNEKIPVFECFYILDLISLAGHLDIVKVNNDVNNLRNTIMHAHDLVYLTDSSREELIYDFASFETFFKRVINLLSDYKQVCNLVALLELEKQ